jgi:hypothetical protein
MLVYPGVSLGSQTASPSLVIGSKTAILYGDFDRDPARPISYLGLVCTISVGASLTYSVQITADPPTSAIVNWNNHDVLVNQTANAYGYVQYPITALRLNVTAYTSGTVNLGVAQWP